MRECVRAGRGTVADIDNLVRVHMLVSAVQIRANLVRPYRAGPTLSGRHYPKIASLQTVRAANAQTMIARIVMTHYLGWLFKLSEALYLTGWPSACELRHIT
jgi:hypothetical protein